MPNISSRGKRQISKPSKRQMGFAIGRNILDRMAQTANMVRDLVEKGQGVNERGQPDKMGCAPADIKSSWTPEQLGAVEEFISTWATEPDQPPAPPKPPKPVKPTKAKS